MPLYGNAGVPPHYVKNLKIEIWNLSFGKKPVFFAIPTSLPQKSAGFWITHNLKAVLKMANSALERLIHGYYGS